MRAVLESWRREWWAPLVDLVYPPRCRLCGGSATDDLACAEHRLPEGLSGPRCDRCAAALPPMLPDGTRCATCRRKRPPFRRALALGDYEQGELREWLLALKHGRRPELAAPLGHSLGECLVGAGVSSEDVLVPVPLHALRRLERGYDQASLLAEAVALVSELPLVRALARVRSTAPQGTPGAVSRRANVRSAFRARRRFSERVAGRNLWLVDDVMTSGATAAECARVLARMGARSTGVLVVARAGTPS